MRYPSSETTFRERTVHSLEETGAVLKSIGANLVHKTVLDRGNGVRTHAYKAPKAVCASCAYRTQCAPKKPTLQWRRSITRIEESAQTSAFKAKMQSEAAQKIYQQRSQIAEFPHPLD